MTNPFPRNYRRQSFLIDFGPWFFDQSGGNYFDSLSLSAVFSARCTLCHDVQILDTTTRANTLPVVSWTNRAINDVRLITSALYNFQRHGVSSGVKGSILHFDLPKSSQVYYLILCFCKLVIRLPTLTLSRGTLTYSPMTNRITTHFFIG